MSRVLPPADGSPSPTFVTCPFCGAQPGDYCTQKNSDIPASTTHEARLHVWREELRIWRDAH